MSRVDRNAISERDVDGFLRSNGIRKLRWYQRDISRQLTSGIVLVVLLLTAVLVYYRGWYGLIGSAGYFGFIGILIAIYLTYTWQWPRLIRHFRKLWRRSY